MSRPEAQPEVEALIIQIEEENEPDAIETGRRILAQTYGPEAIGMLMISSMNQSSNKESSTYFV